MFSGSNQTSPLLQGESAYDTYRVSVVYVLILHLLLVPFLGAGSDPSMTLLHFPQRSPISIGLIKIESDNSLYVQHGLGDTMYLLDYVDEHIVTGNNLVSVNRGYNLCPSHLFFEGPHSF